MSRGALLRICGSCEWVFRGGVECPRCGFGSYGARYVLGAAAYRAEQTQEPWRARQRAALEVQMAVEVQRQRDRDAAAPAPGAPCTT